MNTLLASFLILGCVLANEEESPLPENSILLVQKIPSNRLIEKNATDSEVFHYATYTTNTTTGNPANFRLEGEYLILQASVDTAIFGLDTNNNTVIPNTYRFKHLQYDFSWESGARILCAITIDPHDNWEFGSSYIYAPGKAVLNYTVDNFVGSGDNSNYIATPTGPHGGSSIASYVDNLWRVTYQVVDGFLGRNYAFSKYLSFEPLIGIRGLFVSEKLTYSMNQYYSTTGLFFPSEWYYHLNAKGVGIRPGIASLWSFGQYGGIYGSLSSTLATVRTKYLNSVNEVAVSSGGALTFNDTNGIATRHRILWNFETSVGLQLDIPIRRYSSYFSLKAAYEYIYWSGMNIFNFGTGAYNSPAPLTFQGISIGMAFCY